MIALLSPYPSATEAFKGCKYKDSSLRQVPFGLQKIWLVLNLKLSYSI
jgi:hypothetical protein